MGRELAKVEPASEVYHAKRVPSHVAAWTPIAWVRKVAAARRDLFEDTILSKFGEETFTCFWAFLGYIPQLLTQELVTVDLASSCN
jgi:hypothetical protein